MTVSKLDRSEPWVIRISDDDRDLLKEAKKGFRRWYDLFSALAPYIDLVEPPPIKEKRAMKLGLHPKIKRALKKKAKRSAYSMTDILLEASKKLIKAREHKRAGEY